ncbi:MAG: efflux RND transporter periplasmic adaptor subunit [Kiritimatiellae bacterium]|nr:efflux RND transporter periplasmic adaptor subunit [Kiritimatiellia bacterium]
MSRNNESVRRRRWRRGWPLAAAAIALAAGVIVWRRGTDGTAPAAEEPYFVAQRGPLRISINESGSIQSRERVVIRSEVEGRRTILSIVDEGKYVRKGDLLVELDTSGLEENRMEQQIRVENMEAQWIQARENLLIVSNAAQASIDDAELALRFARLEKEKFEKAEYAMQFQQAQGDISIAMEELQRARDKLDWSRRLMDQGYLTRTEFQADELAAKRAQLNLELAQGKLSILTNYTYSQTIERLSREITKAEMALARAKLRAAADITQALAAARAAESEYQRQRDKLERTLELIRKCRIVAPSDGMVVYATTVSERRWMQEPLRPGVDVVERQELIYLPATKEMMAVVQLPESSLSKLREGLPARITVSALPGRSFRGHVDRIAILPNSSQSWLNPDIKVYDCNVWIDEDTEGLRPGMTCRVEIVIEEYEDAVYVPIQCVLRVAGRPTVYVLSGGRATPRTVEVGLDNNRMIRIISGLEAGERVLLAPPIPPSELEAASTAAPPATARSPAGSTNGPAVWRPPEGGGPPPEGPPRREGPPRARPGRPPRAVEAADRSSPMPPASP